MNEKRVHEDEQVKCISKADFEKTGNNTIENVLQFNIRNNKLFNCYLI